MARTATTAEQPAAAPLSRRILVNIIRDQTASTPRVIWAHEFPLLEDIHGEGNIREVPRETIDEGWTPRVDPQSLHYNKAQTAVRRPSEALGLDWVFLGDPRTEYDRLGQVYGKHPEIDQLVVEHVYGRFNTGMFARVLGRPRLVDIPDDQLRALVLQYGYTLPTVDHDATQAEKDAAAKAAARFNSLTGAELQKLAVEVGVELEG